MKRKTNNRNVYVVFAAFIAAGVRGKFRCLAIFFFSFFEELKSILLHLHRLGRISSLLSFPISSFAFFLSMLHREKQQIFRHWQSQNLDTVRETKPKKIRYWYENMSVGKKQTTLSREKCAGIDEIRGWQIEKQELGNFLSKQNKNCIELFLPISELFISSRREKLSSSVIPFEVTCKVNSKLLF